MRRTYNYRLYTNRYNAELVGQIHAAASHLEPLSSPHTALLPALWQLYRFLPLDEAHRPSETTKPVRAAPRLSGRARRHTAPLQSL